MPDPTFVLSVALFIVAAFGFGFMAGQSHEKRRVWHEIKRMKALYDSDPQILVRRGIYDQERES